MPQTLSYQHPYPFHDPAPPRRQRGAALMVLLIILVVGASAVILGRINPAVYERARERETALALARAKEYLVAWAVTLEGRPGGLPYPDRDTGGGFDGRGDCITNNLDPTAGHLIGQFPWLGQDGCEITSQGIDLADGYGERLWYAVSQNLVRNPASGPPPQPVPAPLNSTLADLDPPPFPWLRVRDGNGGLISDRVAAVIIAPGPALEGQDRSGAAPDSGQYLDAFTLGGITLANFQDADWCPDDDAACAVNEGEDFYVHASEEFNDRLIYITIDELMREVEKRVAGEVARLLMEFKLTNGRFPWLAPFSNPLVRAPVIAGDHDGADDTATLVDNSKEFDATNTGTDDLVWNVTTGATGRVVNRISATNLSTALSGGTEVLFDSDDEYRVAPRALASFGKSTGLNNSDMLTDANADFDSYLTPGAVVANVSDGSWGLVAGVFGGTLRVNGLAGGTEDDFDFDEEYRVETLAGAASGGSATSLVDVDDGTDAGADFTLLDVRAGSPVVNLSDASAGIVAGVAGPTVLDLSGLWGGGGNDFEDGDLYRIGQLYGRVGTRFGLLPIHVLGAPFRTGFSATWDLSDPGHDPGEGRDPDNLIANDISSGHFYGDDLAAFARSTAVAGARTVAYEAGVCTWTRREVIQCAARTSQAFLTGTATGGSGPGVLEDDSRNFAAFGVEAGDRLARTVQLASGTGTADSDGDGLTLDDTTADFVAAGVVAGDLVYNLADGSFGEVTVVAANRLTVGALHGPAGSAFVEGEAYVVAQHDRGVITSVAADTLSVAGLGTDFGAGDAYHVQVATAKLAGTATADIDFDGLTLDDNTEDFVAAGIETGDVVANLSDGSFGIVTNVAANRLTVGALYAGTSNTFSSGDGYEVRHDHVISRRYDMRLDFEGVLTFPGSDPGAGGLNLGYDDVKTRDVALAAGAYAIPPGAAGTRIRIRDYGTDGLVGDVVLTAVEEVVAPGSVTSISALGVHMDMEIGVDLPQWLMDNEWHHLLYAGAAADEMPDGDGRCDLNGPCMSVEDQDGNVLEGAAEAVVIATGPAIATGNRVLGANEVGVGNDCAVGGAYLCHYLDPPPGGPALPSTESNNDEDDIVVRNHSTAVFNDVLIPVCINSANPASCDRP